MFSSTAPLYARPNIPFPSISILHLRLSGRRNEAVSGAIGGIDERAESIGYLSLASSVSAFDADPPVPGHPDTVRLKGHVS